MMHKFATFDDHVHDKIKGRMSYNFAKYTCR